MIHLLTVWVFRPAAFLSRAKMLAVVLVLTSLLLAQPASSTSWGFASLKVKVYPVPSLDNCKMTPEEEPPVGFQTRFAFSCARSDAPLSSLPVYKLFHADSESSTRHLLYRGNEPRA